MPLRRKGKGPNQRKHVSAGPSLLKKQLLTTQIIVTQKHSLELVKTLVTATMIEVAFVRNVFPYVRYGRKPFNPMDPQLSYDSFMNDEARPIRIADTKEFYVWHVPPRGKDPLLDKLLECLESGAHDALNKGHLAALILSFHSVDPDKPGVDPISEANLIESYSIHFEYGTGTITQFSAETQDAANDVLTTLNLYDVKKSMKAVYEEFCDAITNLRFGPSKKNKLPAHYRAQVSLKYHDGTPEDYHPHLFIAGDDNTKKLFELSEPDSGIVTDTGYHRVAFGMRISAPRGNLPALPQVSNVRAPSLPVTSRAGNFEKGSPEVEEENTQASSPAILQEYGASRNLSNIRQIAYSRVGDIDDHDTQQLILSIPTRKGSKRNEINLHSHPNQYSLVRGARVVTFEEVHDTNSLDESLAADGSSTASVASEDSSMVLNGMIESGVFASELENGTSSAAIGDSIGAQLMLPAPAAPLAMTRKRRRVSSLEGEVRNARPRIDHRSPMVFGGRSMGKPADSLRVN